MRLAAVAILSVWIASLAISIAAVVFYSIHTDPSGIVLITNDDVADCLKSVAGLYGAYLGGILSAWLLRKLPNPKLRPGPAVYSIALTCTVLFNLVFLYFLLRGYFVETDVVKDVALGVRVALWFSFIVAPVNLYFFGVKAAK